MTTNVVAETAHIYYLTSWRSEVRVGRGGAGKGGQGETPTPTPFRAARHLELGRSGLPSAALCQSEAQQPGTNSAVPPAGHTRPGLARRPPARARLGWSHLPGVWTTLPLSPTRTRLAALPTPGATGASRHDPRDPRTHTPPQAGLRIGRNAGARRDRETTADRGVRSAPEVNPLPEFVRWPPGFAQSAKCQHRVRRLLENESQSLH